MPLGFGKCKTIQLSVKEYHITFIVAEDLTWRQPVQLRRITATS